MAVVPMRNYVAATPSKQCTGHEGRGLTKVKCLQVAGAKFGW